MMKTQGTTTDKLTDILQILQLARKTGQLALERVIADNMLESGIIILQDGRITDASIGSHKGTSAMNLLSKWGKCNFVFYPSSVQKNPVTPLPITPPRIRSMLRSYGEGEQNLALLNGDDDVREQETAPQSIPNTVVSKLDSLSAPSRRSGLESGSSESPDPTYNCSANAPYRVYPAQEILPYFLSMGFSRAHRQLFLLIDGQRMLPELIRLTGRIPDEVETLLDDLKRVGLVR
jgi:Domain of unknown function (DUF4388)